MRMAVDRSKRVSDTVYAVLFKNIMDLNLLPGSAMSEMDIAKRLNVSRTPVREAFIRLSKEGLVEILPQRGTIVSRIDLQKVEEESFFRETMEFAVMKIFCRNHSEESLRRLRDLLERQRLAVQNDDAARFIDLDDAFHRVFFEETNKLRCYQTIKSISGNFYRIRYLLTRQEGIFHELMRHHEQLIEKLSVRDQKSAQRVLRNHLVVLQSEEDNILERYPDFFVDGSDDTVQEIGNPLF